MSAAAESVRAVRLPREARRTQLLSAALEVFVSSGYHAAAMDDIADRAGVSKPVLYQHFPSKLDLYLALVDAGRDQLVDRVREALDSTNDNKLRVQATNDAYFAFVDESAGAFRLIFESDLPNEPAVRERIEAVHDEIATLISVVIADDTGLPPKQAMLLATGLAGMAQTAARFWLTSDGQISRAEAAGLVSRLGWRGISGIPKHS